MTIWPKKWRKYTHDYLVIATVIVSGLILFHVYRMHSYATKTKTSNQKVIDPIGDFQKSLSNVNEETDPLADAKRRQKCVANNTCLGIDRQEGPKHGITEQDIVEGIINAIGVRG